MPTTRNSSPRPATAAAWLTLVATTAFAHPAGAATWTWQPDMPHDHGDSYAVTAPDASGTDRIYLIGGRDVYGSGGQHTDRVDALDPGSGWATMAPLPTTNAHHAAIATDPAAIAGPVQIFVFGGKVVWSSTTHLATVYRYDTSLDQWFTTGLNGLPIPPIPVPAGQGLADHTIAAGIDASGNYAIYLFGGTRDPGGTPNSSVFKYLPATNTWGTTMADPRGTPPPWSRATVGCDGIIYLVAASGGAAFSPATGVWALFRLPALLTPRENFAVATGRDGRIYVMNGDGTCAFPSGTDLVESYDFTPFGPWLYETSTPWRSAPTSNGGSFHCMGAALGDQVFVFGASETHGSCGVSDTFRALSYGPLSSCSWCDQLACGEGCANRWQGPDGGLWATASDWSAGVTPVPTERALIENTSASSNACVYNLPWTTTVCAVTVRGNAAADQELQITKVTGPAPVVDTTNGTDIDPFGRVVLSEGFLTGGAEIAPGGELVGWGDAMNVTNEGLVRCDDGPGPVDLRMTGGYFRNEPAGLVVVSSNSWFEVPASTFDQRGNLEVRHQGRAELGTVTNRGAAWVQGSGHLNAIDLVNDGELVVDGDGLGTATLVATNSIVNDGCLELRRNVSVSPGVGFVNNGNLVIQPFCAGSISTPIVNNGTICQAAAHFLSFGLTGNAPVLMPSCSGCATVYRSEAPDDNVFTVLGDFIIGTGSDLTMEDAMLEVTGTFDIAIDDVDRIEVETGVLRFHGGVLGQQAIEMWSADLGSSVSSTDPGVAVVGVVEIGTTSLVGDVKLADAHDNSGTGLDEALYVVSLVIEPGSTIDLAGHAIYYGSVEPPDPHNPVHGILIIDSVGGGTLEAADILLAAEEGPATPPGPGVLELGENVPNPFNPTTKIPFVIGSAGRVTVNVYTASGARVRTLVDERLPGGRHEVSWDGRNAAGVVLPSGVYFYDLRGNGERIVRKMTMVK